MKKFNLLHTVKTDIYTNIALEIGAMIIEEIYKDVQTRYVDDVWDELSEISQQENAIERGLA